MRTTFRDLCHQGRLFEINEWLEEAKPIELPTSRRRDLAPLEIAITQGFHSLVEVLLKHGFPTNRRSMWLAVKARRPDLVKLLFDHGAPVDAVSFSTVLSFTNLETIDQFIEHGADTVTGFPIAEGFLIAPRFFCRIYKTYIARFPEWELQRDVALRRAAGEGKLQAVCLLNWLGADARRPIPEKEGEDEELWDTALRAAIWSGHLKIVEQFKVCRDRDDVDELLLNACTFGKIETIRYLVNLGADLNKVEENGTCPASELIHSFSRWVDIRLGHQSYSCRTQGEDNLREAIKMGLRWVAPDSYGICSLRDAMHALEPKYTLRLLRFLKEKEFCPEETLVKTMKTPRMKKHMRGYEKELAKLWPWFGRWVSNGS